MHPEDNSIQDFKNMIISTANWFRSSSLLMMIIAFQIATSERCLGQVQSFLPLNFDGDYSFEFECPTIQRTGTIEVALSADEQRDEDKEADDRVCLVRCSDLDETRFAIYMRADRSAIGFTDGVFSFELPAPLDDGEVHHMAFATAGSVTEVYFDGAYHGYFPLGYGEPNDSPVIVGTWGDGSHDFVGDLHMIRIWDTAVSRLSLVALQSMTDIPADFVFPERHHLLIASQFTAAEAAILQLRPILYMSDTVGAERGVANEQILPVDQRMYGIRIDFHTLEVAGKTITAIDRVRPYTRNKKGEIRDLGTILKEQDERVRSVTTQVYGRALQHDLHAFDDMRNEIPNLIQFWGEWESIPALREKLLEYLFALQDNVPVGTESVQELLELVDQLSKELFDYQKDFKRKVWPIEIGPLKSSLERFRNLLTRLGRPVVVQRRPSVGDPPASEYFDLIDPNTSDEKRLLGMAGLYNGRLVALRFITDRGLSDKTFGNVDDPTATPFVVRFPEAARCTGFISYDSTELHGLAATWIAKLQDGTAPVLTLGQGFPISLGEQSLGNFIREGEQMPVRNDLGVISQARSGGAIENLIDPVSGEVLSHGNYTSFPIVSLYQRTDGSLRVCRDSLTPGHEHDDLVAQHLFWPVEPGGALDAEETASVYLTRDQSSMLEVHSVDRFVWKRAINDRKWQSQVYQRQRPLDISGDPRKKLPWGDTFSSEQRPAMCEFNFRGYHIAKIDPRNYQLGTGTSTRLFRWPSDDSLNYQTTTVGKIVPNGVLLRNDREAAERSRSFDASNSMAHQSAWNINLGMNVGVMEVASFGANASFRHEHETMFEKDYGRSVAMITETKYALVLDRARVKLDPAFRRAVQRLADRIIAGQKIYQGKNSRAFESFFEEWGTHYPYAVTYGGMAYQELSYTASQLSEMTGSGFDLQTQASATIEGVTAGNSLGGGYSWSDKNAKSRKVQDGTVRTIGGDISLGGGWSLPDHHEVPIMLDLRPIPQLLSPIHFADPIVWKELRTQLEDYMRVLSQEHRLPALGSPPTLLELRIDRIRNNTKYNAFFDDTTGGGFMMYYAFELSPHVFPITDQNVDPKSIPMHPDIRQNLARDTNLKPLPMSNKAKENEFVVYGGTFVDFPNVHLPGFGRSIYRLNGAQTTTLPHATSNKQVTATVRGAEHAAQIAFIPAPRRDGSDSAFTRFQHTRNVLVRESEKRGERVWIVVDLNNWGGAKRKQFQIPLSGYVDFRPSPPDPEDPDAKLRVEFSVHRYPRRD